MLPEHPFVGCRRCIPWERLKLQCRLGLLECHFYGNTRWLNFCPFLYGILFQLCGCAIRRSRNEVPVLRTAWDLAVRRYPEPHGQVTAYNRSPVH